VRRGPDDAVSCINPRRDEPISEDVLYTDTPPPRYAKYTDCLTVAVFPASFLDLFVHRLVEELSVGFAYHLDSQRMCHERISGKSGQLGEAMALSGLIVGSVESKRMELKIVGYGNEAYQTFPK
jgi:hypothetical protein